MKNRKASVAKLVALAVVPVSLAAVVAKVAHRHRAEAATQQLRKLWVQQGLMEPAWLQQLAQQGADVNVRDKSGVPILHYAVYRGPALTKIVLDHGADVNAQDNYGNTALIIAVTTPDSIASNSFTAIKLFNSS